MGMLDPTYEILEAINNLCFDSEGQSKVKYSENDQNTIYWDVIKDIIDGSGKNNFVLLRDIRLEEDEMQDGFVYDMIIDIDVIQRTNNKKPSYKSLEVACSLFTSTVMKQSITTDNFTTVVEPWVLTATRFPKEELENGKIELKKTYEVRLKVEQTT